MTDTPKIEKDGIVATVNAEGRVDFSAAAPGAFKDTDGHLGERLVALGSFAGKIRDLRMEQTRNPNNGSHLKR